MLHALIFVGVVCWSLWLFLRRPGEQDTQERGGQNTQELNGESILSARHSPGVNYMRSIPYIGEALYDSDCLNQYSPNNKSTISTLSPRRSMNGEVSTTDKPERYRYRRLMEDLIWEIGDHDRVINTMVCVLERACRDTCPVIGLDCEWCMNSKVSLVQLATLDGWCHLLRIDRTTPWTNPAFRQLMESSSIYKVGVNIMNDAGLLHKHHDWTVRGCIDLLNLVPRHPDVGTIKEESLKDLSKRFLGVDLGKDKNVTCSNWEAERLSLIQETYAAEDALSGALIFVELVRHKVDLLDPDGKERKVTEDEWKIVRALCRGLSDKPYRKGKVYDATDEESYPYRPECLYPQNTKSGGTSEVRKLPRTSARQSKLYDNARLLAPDGQPLCVVDRSKAEWYLSKDLADLVCDSPLTVKLTFEPAGRPQYEGDHGSFYLQEKLNICVCCGADDGYMRKKVVPQEYRKHFPELMKSHQSHDVLLLCGNCHVRSSNADSVLKAILAELCDAPLSSRTYSKLTEDAELKKVRSAARALMYQAGTIPLERAEALCQVLRDFYGCDCVTVNQILTASDLDIHKVRPDYVPHGQKVCRCFECLFGLIYLETIWRQHFIDSMNPRFMPEYWSICHNHDRIRDKILTSDQSAEWKQALWDRCVGPEY